MTLHRDQAGLVGKIIVIWLLVVATLGVAALDAASIVFARFRLSDVASVAAAAGADAYKNLRDVRATCDVVRETVLDGQPGTTIGKTFCEVDRKTGWVTVTLKEEAGTVIAGRLSFTREFTKISVTETARPSEL